MSLRSHTPQPGGHGRIAITDLLLFLIVNLGTLRLAGIFFGGMLADRMLPHDGSGGGSSFALVVTLALILFQALVILATVQALILRRHGLDWSDLGLRPCPRVWYRRAVLLALGLLPVVAIINATIPRISGQPFENPQVLALAPDGFSWFAVIGMTAMGGIVAPIAEEVAFRGLLFPWLRGRMGFAAAALLSAACFAVLHGVVLLVPALFAVGLALAWITERCGSIWPAIVTHGAFNTAMILTLYAVLAGGGGPN